MGRAVPRTIGELRSEIYQKPVAKLFGSMSRTFLPSFPFKLFFSDFFLRVVLSNCSFRVFRSNVFFRVSRPNVFFRVSRSNFSLRVVRSNLFFRVFRSNFSFRVSRSDFVLRVFRQTSGRQKYVAAALSQHTHHYSDQPKYVAAIHKFRRERSTYVCGIGPVSIRTDMQTTINRSMWRR